MRYGFACAVVMALFALTGESVAQETSIVGTWTGTGVVQSKSGQKENVRCQVRYSKSAGKSFGLSATCTSNSGKSQTGYGSVRQGPKGRYAGRVYLAGSIYVRVSGNRQVVTLKGSKGSGRVMLVKN